MGNLTGINDKVKGNVCKLKIFFDFNHAVRES